MKIFIKFLFLFYIINFSFSQISLDNLISKTLNEIPKNSDYFFYDVDNLLENGSFVTDSLKKIKYSSIENIFFILVNKLDYSNSNNNFKILSENFFNEFEKNFQTNYLIIILLSFEDQKINFRISDKLKEQFKDKFIDKDIEKIENDLKEQNIEKIMYNIIQYLENNCLKMINIEDDINWEDLYVIYENEYESKMDNLEPIDNQNDINQIPNEIENKNEEDKNYLDNDNNNNKNKSEKSGKLYYYGILIFILLLCILIYFIFRIINLRKKLSALYFDSKYNNLDYNLEVNN
jgi:hypothetical protein